MTAPTRVSRSVQGFLVVAVMTALTLLASPSAQAHTDLIRSSPSEGDRLKTAPREIELEFSEDVDANLAAVVLSRAGSDPVRLKVAGGDQPAIVLATVPFEAASATEAWNVGYRVTSVDGHPIVGTIEFVVAGSGSTPPAPRDTTSTGPIGPSSAEGAADYRNLGTGQFPWPYAGLAVLVAALAALGTLLALVRLSGRSHRTTAPSTSGDEAS